MKRNSSPFKIAVIVTLVIVALLTALVVLSNNNSESSDGNTSNKQPSISGQPTVGDSDAPVTVVEFGDFKCPACKVWGTDIYPKLINDYVDTGKVKFSFVNVQFHGKESTLASLAAESVYKQSPDAYWEFHKALFNAQPSNHDSKWVTTEKILEVASGIPSIDTSKLKSAIENQEAMDALNKDEEMVTEFGVELTPTIMVGGTMIEDPFDYEAIKQVIEEKLEDQ
ncbi:DsbA family protein [Virgibacillus flavescens]|uniref:DsbA family protein n=1 Tax=Virgibacillus flavescens TaxID=1611422 RepID=UPI003D350651